MTSGYPVAVTEDFGLSKDFKMEPDAEDCPVVEGLVLAANVTGVDVVLVDDALLGDVNGDVVTV